MSRSLQTAQTLCNEVQTFIAVQNSLQQQSKNVGKGGTAKSVAGNPEAPKKRAKRSSTGAGSVWIVIKPGFSALEYSAKRKGKCASFRQNLQASKDARRALEEEAAPAPAEAEEAEEEAVPVAVEEEGTGEGAEESGAVGEEAEIAEETWAASEPRVRLPVGASFASLVVRHGGAVEGDGSLNDDVPNRCIVRAKCSKGKDPTKVRSVPPPSIPAKATRAERRAAKKKLRRRILRGSACKVTSIVSDLKAANALKVNLMTALKREASFMEKRLAAPPQIPAIVQFFDPAQEPPPTPAAATPAVADKAKKQNKGKDEPVAPPAQAEPPKATPAKKAGGADSSGKTKAQLKAEEQAKKPAEKSSPGGKKGKK
jgi:hypothetical protein